MHYRRLGRTGFEVSEIGHGLWGMGDWTGADEAQYIHVLQASVDMGCNFFDTAWAYGQGKSDRLMGELLRRNRGTRLYVATKIPPKNAKWPASPDDSYADVFPRDHVFACTHRILEQLGVDRIDLLQFHVWDDHWAHEEEFLNTVAKLKSEGLIEAFGLSLNRWEPWNGIKALRNGCVDTVQVIYNIFDQAPEDELFPACRELDVGVIARVPMDEGSLGGTLRIDTKFPAEDWRSRYFGPENLPSTVERVDRLKTLLPSWMTLPEMALRFVLDNPGVSSTIVGMRTAGHLRENLAVSDKPPLRAHVLSELRKHRWDRDVADWAS
jgi:aryl-alcohol dehydrogenase-like predicted oxidoreductase